MIFSEDEKSFTLRLERGEKLVESLQAFVLEKKLSGGWIIGLGGLTWAKLGFYDLANRQYKWKRFDQLLELVNLTGNIAWQDNSVIMHLHATVADEGFNTKAGHLAEAEVAGTVEILINKYLNDNGLERLHDEITGLNLLNL